MKYIFIILLVCGLTFAADSNDIKDLSEAVVSMAQELPQKEKQLEEKKVDKAVYETAINSIDKTTQRIEQKLDRLIEKGN